MCGICGVWGDIDPNVIEAMVTAMHHRGPDDNGVYHDNRVGLGMARLAIIDLSPNGHQPMASLDESVWIVFNGEIYNFQSERDILENQGYKFRSTSDTEVVLRMYEHYGDDFLLRLRGIFALAIYDKLRDRLLLARDHFGIKPLLYTHINGRLIFGSEIKALLASDLIPREMNPDALRQLLTFGSVQQPNTMLANVHMLLPAHRLIIENGQTRMERYWKLGVNRHPQLRYLPYDQQVEYVAHALQESVRLQMISDVPLGAFLSGGTDSSILVALMAQTIGQRLKTFSVGFEADGQTYDERDLAQHIADHVGTDHTPVLVHSNEVRDRIQHIASALDQPSVDGVNTYFVSMAARQGMTVAISGTGGDELFAGYPWFWAMAAQDDTHFWRRAASQVIGSIARKLPSTLLFKRGGNRLYRLRRRGHFLEDYASTYHIFGDYRAAYLLAPHLRDAAHAGRSYTEDLHPTDELANRSAIERVSALSLRGYTNNQLLRDIDATSMAHSLEVRVPFLDPVLTDIALSLPDETKLHSHPNAAQKIDASYEDIGAKRILIDAGKPLMPPDFGKQPKRGFTLPFAAWLNSTLLDVLHDTLSESQIKQRGLLDVNQAVQVRDDFLNNHTSWVFPWTLMMLELWQREVLDC